MIDPDDTEAVDRAAEAWVRSHHGTDWWIGTASMKEWEDAYAAILDTEAGEAGDG